MTKTFIGGRLARVERREQSRAQFVLIREPGAGVSPAVFDIDPGRPEARPTLLNAGTTPDSAPTAQRIPRSTRF